MNWKYWVMTKIKPNSVRKPAVTARLPPENRRFANTDMSSIGCGQRRSHIANPISIKVAAPKPTKVRALAHPHEGAPITV